MKKKSLDKFIDSGDFINQVFTPLKKGEKAKVAKKIDSLLQKLKTPID